MYGSFEMIAAPRTHNSLALGVPQQAVQPPAGPVSIYRYCECLLIQAHLYPHPLHDLIWGQTLDSGESYSLLSGPSL